MSLDPVRAARVRRMVPDKSTWPGDMLHMKRIENGSIVEFGYIHTPPSAIAGLISLTSGRQILVFDDIEALIEAGWAVD